MAEYLRHTRVSGIIYLHRITEDRITGSSLTHFKVLEAICGDSFLQHICLVTTRWEMSAPNAEYKEQELHDRFWEKMVLGGARVYRYDNSMETARNIAMELWRSPTVEPAAMMQLQRELVQENKALVDTDAGEILNVALLENEAHFQKTIEQLTKALVDLQASSQREGAEGMSAKIERLKRDQERSEVLRSRAFARESEWDEEGPPSSRWSCNGAVYRLAGLVNLGRRWCQSGWDKIFNWWIWVFRRINPSGTRRRTRAR